MRSEQHRRNVASLPCACCGIEGYSQAAHPNNAEFGKGYSIKSDDLLTFPLCCQRVGIPGCHYEHDNYVGMTNEEAKQREINYIFWTLRTLSEMGKLKAVK